MATPHRTELRAEIPSLEPDGVLLDQLAALARDSATQGPPARTAPWTGWRVALAAVAAASVIGGGAFVAAAMTGEGAHTPAPQGPVTHPGLPEPSEHEARHPERASGGSGGASGSETAQDPQEQSTGSDDQNGSQPQGVTTAPAGPGPVSHPTSDPTDDPGDPGEDDPTTGSTDGNDEGTDTPSDDPSDEVSTPEDGGDAPSEQAAPSDDADPRGE